MKKYLHLILLISLGSTDLLGQVMTPNNDAVLLNYQTNIVVKNNKLYIARSYELQINNRAGERYAEISLPYSRMHKISKVDASIKDKNNIIVKKLKSADIVDRSEIADFSLYEDNFVKEFTLVHNVYPYTICYSYQEQQDAFFYINSWSPCINKNIPTLNASMILEFPSEYKVAYTAQLIDSFKVDTIQKQIRYSWKASYLKQVLPEIYAPDQRTFIPEVDIVPLKFKYDKDGEQNSWIAYGNWEYNLINGLDELPESEKQNIDQLIKNLRDDNEKVKILYHYLQDETRYINISIATGGMKPYPASYVAVNKYGDCKALSNYFKAVLSYAGIKSFYTNVYAGDEVKKIDHHFPSMQFNHVILCVPVSKDTVWLDCTSDGPYNYLGTFTQNREVFLIDKNNSYFTKTPSLSKSDVLVTRNVEINSDLANGFIVSFHSKYKGNDFESLFELSHSISETRKAQIIRNNLIESNFELIDYKLIPANRDSTFIVFEYTVKGDRLLKKYGNDELVGLIPFYIPHFKEPKNRKYPVQIDYPINKLDTLKYQIPIDCVVASLPPEQHITSNYGTYDIQFKQNGNLVEVIKSFVLNAGNYPLEQYKDFYKFIYTVYENENSSYIVTNKKIK
jgi:hypothetical protein